VLADQEAALPVAGQAVGKVGWLTKDARMPGGLVVAHDAVVGNVGEEDVPPVAEPDRPLGPAESRRQLLHAGRVEAVLAEARIEDLHGRIRVPLAALEIERLGGGRSRHPRQAETESQLQQVAALHRGPLG